MYCVVTRNSVLVSGEKAVYLISFGVCFSQEYTFILHHRFVLTNILILNLRALIKNV